MDRQLLRPIRMRVKKKPRFACRETGKEYLGYLQNRFPEPEAMIFIFGGDLQPPPLASVIIDRIDDQEYLVQEVVVVRPTRNGYASFALLVRIYDSDRG